ncbi:MAG: 50S ribosomal protein L6 [Rickettsiales bacterium]|jgi:large subunit ribosomal protein L6|nr:50S ribosomal protein L6 [Rickettsiales bacterium]
MSRMGKLPVKVPKDIKVEINGSTITFAKGDMKKVYNFGNGTAVRFESDAICVEKSRDDDELDKFVGLHRSNINNIVKGLRDGFKRVIEYNGVGYRAALSKNFLVLGLGYSHDIVVKVPANIKITFEKPNFIVMNSEDNVSLGRFAAMVRSLRKTEPYKGKGLKYQGEVILRKEGKKK